MSSRLVGLVAVGVLLSSLVLGQDQRPGDAPYTPTRLQWLEVVLNAKYRMESVAPIYKVSYVAGNDGKTMHLVVTHVPMDLGRLNRVVDRYRDAITKTAHQYGFEGWVQIQEDVSIDQGE